MQQSANQGEDNSEVNSELQTQEMLFQSKLGHRSELDLMDAIYAQLVQSYLAHVGREPSQCFVRVM